jgi:hypothetical protein
VPDPGADAIWTNDPLGVYSPSSYECAGVKESSYRAVPQQIYSAVLCALGHLLMEKSSPHADAALSKEPCLRIGRSINEPEPTEDLSVASMNCDAEFAKRDQRIWQEPFTARLVDRRLRAVRDRDSKSLLSSSDTCSQSGRSTADYKHISSNHSGSV